MYTAFDRFLLLLSVIVGGDFWRLVISEIIDFLHVVIFLCNLRYFPGSMLW